MNWFSGPPDKRDQLILPEMHVVKTEISRRKKDLMNIKWRREKGIRSREEVYVKAYSIVFFGSRFLVCLRILTTHHNNLGNFKQNTDAEPVPDVLLY